MFRINLFGFVFYVSRSGLHKANRYVEAIRNINLFDE